MTLNNLKRLSIRRVNWLQMKAIGLMIWAGIFTVLMILGGCCGEGNAVTGKTRGPYDVTCIEVGARLARCENKEVICYQELGDTDVLQCKFKD